jgi:hypothetical protein
MKLDAVKLGLAGGIVWGVVLLVTTWLSIGTGYGITLLDLFVSLYPGYSITLVGSIVGLLYGFVDAFIGLFLVAWVYNKLVKE